MYKIVPFILFSILFLASCTHKAEYVVAPKTDSFVSYTNIVYGSDDTQQNLDVYLPAVRAGQSIPVILLIHGGSWVVGDKGDFNPYGLDSFFTGKGCAVISMNYRMYGAYPHDVALLEMEDVGLVLDYIKQKATTWNLDPNRICLLGKSSGSQIALLYAYGYNQAGRVKMVIDGFGPTDFTDSSMLTDAYLAGNVGALLGAPYATDMQAWHDYSPIFHMVGAVPTVIYQGNLDVVVPPIQSLMLQDSLLGRGVPNLFFNWVGDGHGWDQVKWLQCRDATWAFTQQYL